MADLMEKQLQQAYEGQERIAATSDIVTIRRGSDEITRLSVEAMEALVEDVLGSFPPAPPPRKKTIGERVASRRRAALQWLHNKLFPDGEYCPGCCW